MERHGYHDVNWVLRSLLAAGLLSVCVVASVMSLTVNAERAEKEKMARAQIEQEAKLVADLAKYLTNETAMAREALNDPRLKPAPSMASFIAEDYSPAGQTDIDFTTLTIAKLNAEERTCLAQAIYYEARSEPRIGQLAVADVVLNRVASPLYPNSICEVVFQGSERRTGCQFSFTCDGAMHARINQRKWNASEDLAGAVLAGLRAPVSRNATHYHATYVSPRWAANLTPTATIGTHKFYKFPSRRTVASASASAAM